MTKLSDWLEHQYWTDVIAVRPDEEIGERIAKSSEVRAAHNATLDLAYGPHERQKLDLFLPTGSGPWPLLVFIHGGYWKRGSKDEWAFLGPGWNSRGVAYATLGYRLAPAVRLPQVVADVRGALLYLAENAESLELDISRVVLSGISAGAHLAAMLVTGKILDNVRPIGAALLSGVYDPRPLENTSPGQALFESLSLDIKEISPLGRLPPADGSYVIAWGADETAVFENQSKMLATHWANWGVMAETLAVPNTNHFTIVECLQADSGGRVKLFIERHLC